MPKKPKPATAGEKIEMKRFGLSLCDVRTRGPAKRAAAIDRAIARAVRKERERCAYWADCYDTCGGASHWIMKGREKP